MGTTYVEKHRNAYNDQLHVFSCIDQQWYRFLGQSSRIYWTSVQKFVVEISWLSCKTLTFHLSCNIITFSEVCQCFSWSETSPKYWHSARWCMFCYTMISLVIFLFAVDTSTLWCWECRQCFLRVSGHSEHQYVFDIRFHIFAFYVLRITYLRIVQLWYLQPVILNTWTLLWIFNPQSYIGILVCHTWGPRAWQLDCSHWESGTVDHQIVVPSFIISQILHPFSPQYHIKESRSAIKEHVAYLYFAHSSFSRLGDSFCRTLP